jgi:hypothetical protein
MPKMPLYVNVLLMISNSIWNLSLKELEQVLVIPTGHLVGNAHQTGIDGCFALVMRVPI